MLSTLQIPWRFRTKSNWPPPCTASTECNCCRIGRVEGDLPNVLVDYGRLPKHELANSLRVRCIEGTVDFGRSFARASKECDHCWQNQGMRPQDLTRIRHMFVFKRINSYIYQNVSPFV